MTTIAGLSALTVPVYRLTRWSRALTILPTRPLPPFFLCLFTPPQELATEIILTLGQAFEVAYQLALRGQSGNGAAASGSHQDSCQRLPQTNSHRT